MLMNSLCGLPIRRYWNGYTNMHDLPAMIGASIQLQILWCYWHNLKHYHRNHQFLNALYQCLHYLVMFINMHLLCVTVAKATE